MVAWRPFRLLLVLCLAIAQLTPAIHAIDPHEEELAHCVHQDAATHVERHDIEHEEDACQICVFAAGATERFMPAGAISSFLSAYAPPAGRDDVPVALTVSLPDTRGPPGNRI